MRIASVLDDGSVRVGVVEGPDDELRVHLLDPGVTVLELLRSGSLEAAARDARSARAVALDSVQLLAPLEPPTVRDFVTFEEHVEGMRALTGVPDAWYEAPAFYFSNPYATRGPRDDVPVPPGSSVLDFELEVAAVIGRAGSDLDAAGGAAAIAGYTILNDWSARDLQSREMQVGLGPAKGKDTATTLGPWLVTADEFTADEDGFLDLALTAEVNGRVVGSDLLSNMGWPFGELVAYASRGHRGPPGRRARLGDLRPRRVPRRAVGAWCVARGAAAARAGRRRDADRRGHRHPVHPGGGRGRPGADRRGPPRPRRRPADRVRP